MIAQFVTNTFWQYHRIRGQQSTDHALLSDLISPPIKHPCTALCNRQLQCCEFLMDGLELEPVLLCASRLHHWRSLNHPDRICYNVRPASRQIEQIIFNMVVVALFRVTIALIFNCLFILGRRLATTSHHQPILTIQQMGRPSIRARPMQTDIIIIVVVIVQHRSEGDCDLSHFLKRSMIDCGQMKHDRRDYVKEKHTHHKAACGRDATYLVSLP